LFQNSEPGEDTVNWKEFPTLADVRRKSIAESERRYLEEVLKRCRGKINLSAATSGISTRQFHKLIKKYGLRKEDFKPAG
jgi:DNA-binding NtrC family response regulator